MFVGIYLGSAAGLIPSLILTWLLGIFCLRLSRPLTSTTYILPVLCLYRAENFTCVTENTLVRLITRVNTSTSKAKLYMKTMPITRTTLKPLIFRLPLMNLRMSLRMSILIKMASVSSIYVSNSPRKRLRHWRKP